MATKKQKRLLGEQKAEIQRQESIRSGLLAQRKDRERREAQEKKIRDDRNAKLAKSNQVLSRKEAFNAMKPKSA